MAQKQYTQFKAEEVIPTLLDKYLAEAFPSMEFVDRGDRWQSKYHIDGSISSSRDQSYIYKSGTILHDNNGDEVGIFNFAMAQFNTTDFVETLKRLADICNLQLPEPDHEYTKSMEAAKQKQDALTASMNRQKQALFAQEGKVVLDYLHDKRGYTDDTIKAMGLGYLSQEEAARLNELGEELPTNITDFPLSIPYTSRGKLRGFKFRYVTDKANKYGKAKYRNTKSLSGKMNGLPFLYSPQNIKERVIIVEGELDALHAYTKGIKNVVATSGGSLKEETLSLLMESGTLKRVFFIPDNDPDGRGNKFVKNAIKIVEEQRLEAFVVTLPEGSKDVDEYLTKATANDLNTLIEGADKAKIWEFWQLIDELQKKYPEEYLSGIHESETEAAVFSLANSCKSELLREEILNNYAKCYNIPISGIEAKVIARANEVREAEEAKNRADKAKAAADTYSKLVAEGKVGEANSFMAEALAEQKKLGGTGTYGDLLKVPTRAERLARFKDKPEALETSYQFTEGGEPLPFTLPSGALTMVAAPTSHGKSTFLRNLALDVVKRYKDKNVLYFTFEESEEDVIAQFTNTYVDTLLHAPSSKYPQLETIINYYRTGEAKYIANKTLQDFQCKEMEFSTNYLDNGRIRIYYRDYNLETLIEALEFAVNHIPTKAIFVDYIQILRSQKLAKQPRNEQLKEICISLKDFSVKYKLPVVLAAQLNREAKTPFRMDNNQMAESSDIEKAANTIVCLWNSSFKASTYGDKGLSKEEKEELDTLKEKKFELGKSGKIFAKLTKKRGSRGVGMYALFEYKGYSGKIDGNYNPEAEQTWLPSEGTDTDDSDIF